MSHRCPALSRYLRGASPPCRPAAQERCAPASCPRLGGELLFVAHWTIWEEARDEKAAALSHDTRPSRNGLRLAFWVHSTANADSSDDKYVCRPGRPRRPAAAHYQPYSRRLRGDAVSNLESGAPFHTKAAGRRRGSGLAAQGPNQQAQQSRFAAVPQLWKPAVGE